MYTTTSTPRLMPFACLIGCCIAAIANAEQLAVPEQAEQAQAHPKLNLISKPKHKTVSPDGRVFATFYQNGWDEVISIHDAKSGKQIKTIVGHGDNVQAFKFTADSKLLASHCERKGWAVWDVETGKLLMRLPTVEKNAAKQQPQESIYVKVLLPIEPTDTSPKVEHWIEKELQQHGQKKLRAMTDWVKLSEGESIEVWNACVDDKGWGCPVGGEVIERGNGRIEVDLCGWAPIAPEITGNELSNENGARAVANVSIGTQRAFFAMVVGDPKDSGDRSK